MAGDKVLSIPLEFQSLAIVLTYQVAQPRLCKPDSDTDLRRERPNEFGGTCIVSIQGGSDARDGRNLAVPPRSSLGRLVRLCMRRERRMEECRCRRVDGARQEHEALCEHIRCKSDNLVSRIRRVHIERIPENSVTIDTGMLKVDSSCPIRTNDDLKLFVASE